MSSFLKYVHYPNDIFLISHRVMDIDQMALILEKGVSRVGLKIKRTKPRFSA